MQYVYATHVPRLPLMPSPMPPEEGAKKIVAAWAKERVGIDVSDWSDGADLLGATTARWATIAGERGRLSRLVVAQPDPSSPWTWQTTIWVGRDDAGAWIRLRIGLEPRDEGVVIDPSVSVGAPRFLNSLVLVPDGGRRSAGRASLDRVTCRSRTLLLRVADAPSAGCRGYSTERREPTHRSAEPRTSPLRDRTRRRCRATYDVRRVGPDHPDQECVWRCHQVVLAGLQPRLASVPSPTVHVSRPARRNRSIRRQPGCAPRASSWIRFWTSCSGDRSPSRSHSPRGRRGTRTPRGTASRCKGGSRRPHRRGVRGLQ